MTQTNVWIGAAVLALGILIGHQVGTNTAARYDAHHFDNGAAWRLDRKTGELKYYELDTRSHGFVVFVADGPDRARAGGD